MCAAICTRAVGNVGGVHADWYIVKISAQDKKVTPTIRTRVIIT